MRFLITFPMKKSPLMSFQSSLPNAWQFRKKQYATYVDSMVTQMSSTQSTQRSLCSTGTTPYVIRWANGQSFHPAWTVDHIKQNKIKPGCEQEKTNY
jgi:hypothetical protein